MKVELENKTGHSYEVSFDEDDKITGFKRKQELYLTSPKSRRKKQPVAPESRKSKRKKESTPENRESKRKKLDIEFNTEFKMKPKRKKKQSLRHPE